MICRHALRSMGCLFIFAVVLWSHGPMVPWSDGPLFGAEPVWQEGPGYRFRTLSLPGAGADGFARLAPEVTGIFFTNYLSDRSIATNRILENGSGVALGDIDGDSWCDIYFCRLEGPDALYRNLGNGRFEDITAGSGIVLTNEYSTGA